MAHPGWQGSAWVTSSGPQLIRYPGAPRKLPDPPDRSIHRLRTYSTAKLSGSLAEHTQASSEASPTLGPESLTASYLQRAQSSQLVRSHLLDRSSLLELCTASPLSESGTDTTPQQPRRDRRQGHISSIGLLLPGIFHLIYLPELRGRSSQDDGVECKRYPRAQQLLATRHPPD